MERDLNAGQELGPYQELNMGRDIRSTSWSKAGDDPCVHHRRALCQLRSMTVRRKCSVIGKGMSMRIVRDGAVHQNPRRLQRM
jgi:hypothetical protein